MLLLNEEELRRCVVIDLEALRRVEDVFRALAAGETTVPPPMALDVPERQGEVHIKSARITSPPAMVVKIVAGFYGNPTLGLPISSGLMILMSSENGKLTPCSSTMAISRKSAQGWPVR